MAPEQLKYGQPNKKTDVYSFAMTMYEVRFYVHILNGLMSVSYDAKDIFWQCTVYGHSRPGPPFYHL